MPVNGKIAMGLDDGDRLIGVDVCDDSHDILLATSAGKAIRFAVESLRVFRSRASEGVRGIDVAAGDAVISMSIIDHMTLTTEEREELIRIANARRRAAAQEEDGEEAGSTEPELLESATVEAMLEREQLILSVTVNGYGKRSSAFEYRVTNRGGQGIINIETSERNGAVAATFPVGASDHLMLVTDKGKTIRIPGRRHPRRRPQNPGRDACSTPSPASTSSRWRGSPMPARTVDDVEETDDDTTD